MDIVKIRLEVGAVKSGAKITFGYDCRMCFDKFYDLMSQSLYAFYGSLRRGMRLHNQFKNDLHYRYSVWLKGYDLYSLGNYPYGVNSGSPDHKILVEVNSILNAETEKAIHEIEIEAGYYADKIQVGNDCITIYLFESTANNLRIESGDWCSFFRQ